MSTEDRGTDVKKPLFGYLPVSLQFGSGGSRRQRISAYGFAVAATLATLLLRMALGMEFEERTLLILFVFPIVLSAYLGGLGPGLTATFLSAALVDYFLIPPLNSFQMSRSPDIGQLLMLVTNGAFISVLTEALRRAQARSEQRTIDFLTANEKLAAEITDRKRIEEALRASESRIRSIFLAAPVGIGLVTNRNLVDVNDTLCSMMGYAREELVGRSSRMLYPSDEEYEYVGNEKYRQIAEKVTGMVETVWRRKDGSLIQIILSSTPLDWQELSKGVTFTALDITDRERAEKELRNSLKEKEVLLREVHHRVKNNMQIISSLIDMQSYYITDKQSRELLRECQNRIKSMALVHEELYSTQDFASLDFDGYITNLVNSLYVSYAADKDKISLEIVPGNVTLEIDEAIPCGMIVNELVSNSLKHAFPDGRGGTIRVKVQESHEKLVLITVADTGVGLPATLDPSCSETLGLQLVFMLTEQLHGQLCIDRDNGTGFQIAFRKKLNESETS